MSDPLQKHTLTIFEKSLQQLRDDAARMASLTSQNLANAVRGLLERNDDLCNKAIVEDEEVDRLEKAVDREGVEVMIRFSPVASDLRHVVSTMKVSNNLERISDQAVNIAKRARRINRHAELPETKLIEPLYEMAASLLDSAITAFREDDIGPCLTLEARDKSLDKAQKQAIKRLTERAEEDPQRVADYIDLILIARFLERVGDRSVNIGEDCVYAASAVDIRHGGEHPKSGEPRKDS